MIKKLVLIVIVLEGISFLAGALLHSGIGIMTLHEPKIIPAMIVESLCGIFLIVSAFAIGTHKKLGWKTALAAHIFSIVGVLLGIVALALGRGPTTELNYIYHRIILTVLIIMVLVLITKRVRSSIRVD